MISGCHALLSCMSRISPLRTSRFEHAGIRNINMVMESFVAVQVAALKSSRGGFCMTTFESFPASHAAEHRPLGPF